MRLERNAEGASLHDIGALAAEAEGEGYDGLVTFEATRDPFVPLFLAAEHTQRLELTTAVAVAFARNPMTTASIAHDLQAFSGGRFSLGLGPQIKTHI
jgi:alkanesulfonate monooxygenase SsuD/methylene tetrahydromethanopterin reductase-like flavin-dependent oxidoreductase (luciferase family)